MVVRRRNYILFFSFLIVQLGKYFYFCFLSFMVWTFVFSFCFNCINYVFFHVCVCVCVCVCPSWNHLVKYTLSTSELVISHSQLMNTNDSDNDVCGNKIYKNRHVVRCDFITNDSSDSNTDCSSRSRGYDDETYTHTHSLSFSLYLSFSLSLTHTHTCVFETLWYILVKNQILTFINMIKI